MIKSFQLCLRQFPCPKQKSRQHDIKYKMECAPCTWSKNIIYEAGVMDPVNLDNDKKPWILDPVRTDKWASVEIVIG